MVSSAEAAAVGSIGMGMDEEGYKLRGTCDFDLRKGTAKSPQNTLAKWSFCAFCTANHNILMYFNKPVLCYYFPVNKTVLFIMLYFRSFTGPA